jgi:hypothetical protein
MNIFSQNHNRPAVVRKLAVLLASLGALAVSGCDSPDASDGTRYEAIVLPTDTLLNLACADVGIFDNTCVLEDPENPFATTAIIEFDENNPEAFNKLQLANQIPPGPDGAKARFYFWATALARRASGENQFFTASALHELWSLNSDPIIREQALKAYRSVLDYFYGSVFFFACCEAVSNDGLPLILPATLNEATADILYRNPTGFRRLVDGDPLNVIELLGEWGYTYRPATPPNYDDGVVGVISF